MSKVSKKSNAQMGLETKSFPKNKQWMVDQDYSDKLSPEEKEFLGRFNQEYYRNRFESSEKDLHSTPEQKKSCYSNENARNRDLYAIKNTGGMVVGSSTVNDGEGNEIDLLDTVADYDMGYAAVDELHDYKQSIKKNKKTK